MDWGARLRSPDPRRLPIRVPTGWLLGAAVAAAPAVLSGQAPPFGSEFQGNTYTTGSQADPAVASAGDGTFVVVWTSTSEDGSSKGVFGQSFDKNGLKVGAQFQVNTTTTGDQYYPALAVATDGAFVVAWESKASEFSQVDVFGQRFDASGAKAGSEFSINTYTTGKQAHPVVAIGKNDSFTVVWESADQDGSSDGIFGQHFDAAGAKVGAEFLVNSNTFSSQYGPAIASDGAGNLVVVWRGQDLSSGGIFGQRFDAAGGKAGSEFQVNTYTTSNQAGPRLAVDSRGDFVVVWTSQGQDGSGNFGAFGQRFNSSAEKVGLEFQVNSYTTSDQAVPSVAFGRRGTFMVVWSSFGQDGEFTGIFGREFERLGNPVGPDFQINTHTPNSQSVPDVVNDGVGLTVVWQDGEQDGSNNGVFGRAQYLLGSGLGVDLHGTAGTSNLNGVLEPGEAAIVEPGWRNESTFSIGSLDGYASSFTGPAGGTYTLLDGLAHYSPNTRGGLGGCYDAMAGACYAVQVSGTRPATHWDAVLQEDLASGGTKFWKLHLGDSFTDVLRTQPFYKKIETVLHYGITSGCGGGLYCPEDAVPRDQMAIFIAKGIAGAGELVPKAGVLNGQPYNCSPGGVSRFDDVSPTDSFCRHVHYIAARSVILGCNPATYCPGQLVTRDAMASFIAKAILAPGGGAAVPVAYTDPVTSLHYSCNAGIPDLHFTDVPVSNAFCRHIHYLWAKGVIEGCSATKYCPGAPVNREAMAKFIANAFDLALYGP